MRTYKFTPTLATEPVPDMAELPYWTNESPLTHAYVANTCPHMPDAHRESLTEAAKLFRVATDHFIDWVDTREPFRLDRLNFTTASGWQAFACQARERYRAAHHELIQDDRGYRTSLGETLDAYNTLSGTRLHPNETEARRQRRYQQLGHETVKVAAFEGIPTSIAAYAVAPATVRTRDPQLDPKEQAMLAELLIPGARELSRHLARHSKQGNERLLRAIARVGRGRSINYGTLSYNPNDFNYYANAGRYILHTVGDYKEPTDLQPENRFRGCPALLYGSIAELNRFFERTIQRHDLYRRSIPGAIDS
jgi:hypothetical protein